jgi:hypothetical protein
MAGAGTAVASNFASTGAVAVPCPAYADNCRHRPYRRHCRQSAGCAPIATADSRTLGSFRVIDDVARTRTDDEIATVADTDRRHKAPSADG